MPEVSPHTPQLHAVAIAGGHGTRLWPLSRRAHPKPLLALDSGQTLLGATFERVRSLVEPSRWWMVVGAAHADGCRAAAPAVPRAQVLVEPMARNTLPALVLAAVHLERVAPEALLLVLPADHHVRDAAAFVAALRTAAAAAAGGAIATLGIRPSRPETGYGYIEVGAPDARGGHRAAAFREKPDRASAARYLAAGSFVWNAGVFVLAPAALRRELVRQRPAAAEAMQRLRRALDAGDVAQSSAAFAAIEATSIDYGVMEAAADVVVVPVDCGWSDLGDVAALAELLPADASGNVTWGPVALVEARDNIVHTEDGHVVALLGVEGLAVVHTADATLVMPRERAQDVRRVVAQLEERGWDAWR